ncbi:MAG: hypothetical protein KJO29_02760 [Bacteroidia bacterium]|nr:hypothetical protein [Bacteroidia bacterium]
MYKTILGLSILMIGCFGNGQSPISGLVIDNKINRGINYTDPLGTDFSIRYIPITITNDSTISIHLQMAFLKEYNYPHPNSHEKFRLIPLPKEWALDGVEISKSMINEITGYIENPALNDTIGPGKKIILAIGSIYPRPAKSTGVLPRKLFTVSDTDIFPECDWHLEKDSSSNQKNQMGLKVIFGEKCMIIPCGQISYVGQ